MYKVYSVHFLKSYTLDPPGPKPQCRPWALKLSWLENAYLCPLFSVGTLDL